MKRIIVLGKSGQLAKALAKVCDRESTLFIGKDGLDLCSPEQIKEVLSDREFDVLINCMAYTAVDAAETDAEMAHKINAEAPKKLAEICAAKDALLIHFSTDYVFGKVDALPLTENQPTQPQSAYGRSKLAGEENIRRTLTKHLIVRTAWLYGKYGSNFLLTMLRLSESRTELNVVFDQIGSPTYVIDLAEAVWKIANMDVSSDHYGTYHFSNEGVCSWYDFAVTIFNLKGISMQVNPILSGAYPAPAVRPNYSVLDKTKIKTNFALTIPHWEASLRKCLKSIDS